MYYNLKYIHEKGLTLPLINLLQIISQNSFEPNENEIALYANDYMLHLFEAQKLTKQIKGKKKDSDFSKLRITSKGKEILELAGTPGVTAGDEKMFNYLCDMYLDHEDEDRTVGNKKKTRIYCAQFRQLIGIGLHEMFYLCKVFLEEYPYTKKLEYIFLNSNKIRYGKLKNNLEESSLYQFYDSNKERLEAIWDAKIEKENRKK
jgi:hypothetical protein